MKLKLLNRVPSFLRNKYLISGLVFIVWILFFDNYNFLFHQELKSKRDELKSEYLRLRRETEKNKIFLRNLNNDAFLEKYAREKFFMKKAGEDVYILNSED